MSACAGHAASLTAATPSQPQFAEAGEAAVSGGFREVDHTADVAVYAWGESLNDLFRAACDGLISLTAGAPSVQPGTNIPVSAAGRDATDTLIRLLNEIIYTCDSQQTVPCNIIDMQADATSARCKIQALPCRDVPDIPIREIKAATYHGAHIQTIGDKLTVTVIFDT